MVRIDDWRMNNLYETGWKIAAKADLEELVTKQRLYEGDFDHDQVYTYDETRWITKGFAYGRADRLFEYFQCLLEHTDDVIQHWAKDLADRMRENGETSITLSMEELIDLQEQIAARVKWKSSRDRNASYYRMIRKIAKLFRNLKMSAMYTKYDRRNSNGDVISEEFRCDHCGRLYGKNHADYCIIEEIQNV